MTKDSPSGLAKQEFLGRLYVILNLTLKDLELKSQKGMSVYIYIVEYSERNEMLALPLPYLCFFHNCFAGQSRQGIEAHVEHTVQAHYRINFFTTLLSLLFDDEDNFHK